MNWYKKLRKWYLCRKYGICRIHFTLMRRGGDYYPIWICDECDKVNTVKHEDRICGAKSTRTEIADMLRKEETRNSQFL